MSPSFTPNWLSGAPALALCLRRASSPRDLSCVRTSLTVMAGIIQGAHETLKIEATGFELLLSHPSKRRHRKFQILLRMRRRHLRPDARLALRHNRIGKPHHID